MKVTRSDIESLAAACLSGTRILPEIAAQSAWACGWLMACDYAGLTMLDEALTETQPSDHRPALELDAIGLDLRNVSCVFSASAVADIAIERQRVFLRNVRHGLYLLPFSVRAKIGIGCPVDPGFALGGHRAKNPYEEKLAEAEANGIAADDTLWARLEAQAKDFSRS